MLFSELDPYLQMSLERDCKIMESALLSYASYLDTLKLDDTNTASTMINDDIDNNIIHIKELAEKMAICTDTNTIKTDKGIISESLKFYYSFLGKHLSKLRLQLSGDSLYFDKLESEIKNTKRLVGITE